MSGNEAHNPYITASKLGAGTGRGGFSDFSNGYLPLRGVNTQIWPTPSNKRSLAWNEDVKSLYFTFLQ